MTGLIVTAVKAAILFEVEHAQGGRLAADRLWFWRACDLRRHPGWCPAVNRAFTNHFLAVHRENRITARYVHVQRWLTDLGAESPLPPQGTFARLPGAGARGVPSEATAPPPAPGSVGISTSSTASNTTPFIIDIDKTPVGAGCV